MQNSPHSYLKNIQKIVLCAGHGGDNTSGNGYDPGAVDQNYCEADEVIKITDMAASLLRNKGLVVDVVPHHLNLGPSIDWINDRYPAFDSNSNDKAWVVEIHRDWANYNLPETARNDQMGVYYWGDANGDNNNADDDVDSRAIADGMLQTMLRLGAYNGTDGNIRNFNGSWSKDHYIEWSKFHLGWIHSTNPIAHLVECGFMSGRHDDEHLFKLATWVAAGLYEAFTGNAWVIPEPVVVVAEPVLTIVATESVSGPRTTTKAVEVLDYTNNQVQKTIQIGESVAVVRSITLSDSRRFYQTQWAVENNKPFGFALDAFDTLPVTPPVMEISEVEKLREKIAFMEANPKIEYHESPEAKLKIVRLESENGSLKSQLSLAQHASNYPDLTIKVNELQSQVDSLTTQNKFLTDSLESWKTNTLMELLTHKGKTIDVVDDISSQIKQMMLKNDILGVLGAMYEGFKLKQGIVYNNPSQVATPANPTTTEPKLHHTFNSKPFNSMKAYIVRLIVSALFTVFSYIGFTTFDPAAVTESVTLIVSIISMGASSLFMFLIQKYGITEKFLKLTGLVSN